MAKTVKRVDFEPIDSCIKDIREALDLELAGADVNLLPDKCQIWQSDNDPGLWLAFYPDYDENVVITFYFYTNEETGMLMYVGAEQDDNDYWLSTDETLTIEDLWEWLELNGETGDEIEEPSEERETEDQGCG